MVVGDDYEAANLRAGLLTLRKLGLDTGDWLGQIEQRLPYVDQVPNRSVEDQVEQVLAHAVAAEAEAKALRDALAEIYATVQRRRTYVCVDGTEMFSSPVLARINANARAALAGRDNG